MRHRDVGLAWALLALVGYWSPWLTQPAAALRLNGYELSEWVTFLPGVRDGSPVLGRPAFLIPLACLAPLFGLAATRPRSSQSAPLRRPSGLLILVPTPLRDRPWGWVVLGLGLACILVVVPPYPYLLTACTDPDYQFQLSLAFGTLLILLLGLYLPDDLKNELQIVISGLGGGYSLWSLVQIWPVASGVLNASWTIGLGWPVMVLGFAGLVVNGWARLFAPKA